MAETRRHLDFDTWLACVEEQVKLDVSSLAAEILVSEHWHTLRHQYDRLIDARVVARWARENLDLEQHSQDEIDEATVRRMRAQRQEDCRGTGHEY
jgi:hypothetical protein